MLTEEDVDRALSQTIELYFYNIKSDDRISWIGTIAAKMNEKRPEMRYHDLYEMLEKLCMDHSEKSEYKPKLGKILRSLIFGRTATDKECINAEWELISDCDMCFRGEIHAYLWNEDFSHAELRYHSCSCKKGESMQKPVYMGTWDELKELENEYGERFEYGPTKPVTPEEVALLKAKIDEKMADNFDPATGNFIPF
jgi:hypothetical protein